MSMHVPVLREASWLRGRPVHLFALILQDVVRDQLELIV